MAIKWSNATLNPFESAYNKLRGMELFNEYDWNTALRRGENDLNAYIGTISESDKIDVSALNERYLGKVDKMDYDTRMLMYQNELFGDKNDENRKERKIVTGYDDKGEPVYETAMLNDYEYNDRLLQDWANYQDTVDKERLARYEKHNADFGEKILYGLATTAGLGERLVKGFVDQTFATLDLIDAVSTSGFNIEGVRNKISDDYVGTLDYWSFSEGWDKEVQEWSSKYTYLYDVSGEATWAGKYLANAAYSIGQMLPAMVAEYATAGLYPSEMQFAQALGQATTGMKVGAQIVHGGTYYSGMMAQNLRDSFNSLGEDVSTYRVFGKVALQTSLDYIVEQASAKIFGGSVLDRLALGMTKTSVTGNIIGNYVKDVLVEGAEETVQEFTSWLSTNIIAGFDKNDPFYQTLNAQTLVDAFILGSISSLATGGIDTLKNTVKSNSDMKEVLSHDQAYQELLKTSKKQARKYKAGLMAFLKNYTDVMNELNSWETIESAKTDGAIKVTKQMIMSYNTLMSFYGEFGEQRVQAAEELLTKLIEGSQQSGGPIVTEGVDENGDFYLQKGIEEGSDLTVVDDVYYYGKGVSKNLDPLRSIRLSANLLFASVQDAAKVENLKKAVAEVTTNGDATAKEVGNVQNVYDSEKEQFVNEGVSEQATKTAKELADKGKEVVLTDNTATILEFDNVVFVPMADIENLKADEILQAAEVRTVVTTLIRQLPKSIMDTLVNLYSKYDKKADKTRVIYNTLFNQSFYNIALMNADKEVMELLVMLDNVVTDIMSRKSNKDDKAAYEEIVHKVRKTMGASIVLYACNNYKVPLESLTVLNETQKDFVRKHRYNQMLADRLIAKTATEADLNVLRNRINSLILTKQEKAQLYADITSDSSGTRKRGVNTLDEKYNYIYRGKYNDIIYMAGNDVKSCMFNEFARINEVTLENFLTEKTNNKLQAAVIEAYGSYSVKNRDAFLKGKFELFTNNNYTIDIVDTGKVKEVVIVEKDDYDVSFSYSKGEGFSKPDILEHDSKNKVWSAPASDDKLVRTYYLDILDKKISNVERAFITMEDIVSNPNIYLSDKVKQEILDQYGIVNKQSAYSYLSNNVAIFSNNRLGLSISNEGTVNVVSYVKMSEYLNKTVMEPAKSTTTLFDKWVGKADEPLSTFVNIDKLPEEFKKINVKVIQSETYGSEFEIVGDKYTIVISSGKQKTLTNALFRVSLMHELHHAIQYFNNEAEGFTDNYVIDKSVVDDIKAHVPEYINQGKSDADKARLAKDFIYYNAFGEIESVGRTDNNLRVYPIVIKTDSKKDSKVTMPWGSTFTLTHKDGKWTMKALYELNDEIYVSRYKHNDKFMSVDEEIKHKLLNVTNVYAFDNIYDLLPSVRKFEELEELDDFDYKPSKSKIKNDLNLYDFHKFAPLNGNHRIYRTGHINKQQYLSLSNSERINYVPIDARGGIVEITDDEYVTTDYVNSINDHLSFTKELANLIKKGFFSKALTRSDFDRKKYKSTLSQDKRDAFIRRLYKKLNLKMSFEKFLNIDLPFVRVQTTDKLYDTGFVSVNGVPREINDFVHTILNDAVWPENILTKIPHEKMYLLVGTYKPKDIIFFINNVFNEVAIDTSKIKSVKVYDLSWFDYRTGPSFEGFGNIPASTPFGTALIFSKDGKEVFVEPDNVNVIKEIKAKSFTDKPAKIKKVTKEQFEDAKAYVDMVNKLQTLNRQSSNFQESVKKIEKELDKVGIKLTDPIIQKIEGNQFVPRQDKTYWDKLITIRTYQRQERDKATRVSLKAKRKLSGQSYDTQTITKGFINKLNGDDTALSYYSPEKHEYNRRISNRMVLLLLSLSDNDLMKLESINENFANQIRKGMATDDAVYDFIRKCASDGDMDKWIFDKIRNSFFPDSPFKNFKMVLDLLDSNLPTAWALYKYLEYAKLDQFLELDIPVDIKTSKELNDVIDNMANSFKEFDKELGQTRFNYWAGVKRLDDGTISTKDAVALKDINWSQAALTALRYYDRTLASLYHIAANVRKTSKYYSIVKGSTVVSTDAAIDNTKDKGASETTFGSQLKDDSVDIEYSSSLEPERQYIYDAIERKLDFALYTLLENKGKPTKDFFNSVRFVLNIIDGDKFKKLDKDKKKTEIINFVKPLFKNGKLDKSSIKDAKDDFKNYVLEIMNDRDVKLNYVRVIMSEEVPSQLSDVVLTTNEPLPKEPTARRVNERIRGRANTALANLTPDNFYLLPKEYRKYFEIVTIKGRRTVIFNDKVLKHVYVPKTATKKDDDVKKEPSYRLNDVKQLLETEKVLIPIFNDIKSGKYFNKETAKLNTIIEKQQRKIKRLEKTVVQTKVDAENKIKYYTEINGNATFNMYSDTKLPQAILEMMNQTFGKTAKSTTKFLTQTDQRHMRISAKKWVEDNAETLENLSATEVEQAIDFFENAIFNPQATEGDIVRYEAFKIALFAYWIQKAQIGELEISDKHLETLKTLERTKVQVGATVIQVWRDVLAWVDPLHTAKKQILKGNGIDVSDADLYLLSDTIADYNKAKLLYDKDNENKDVADQYKKTIERFMDVHEQLKAKYLKQYQDNKKAKKGLDKWFDTILKIQKAMMLSAPSTWVRSWQSNAILTGVNKAADVVGNVITSGTAKAVSKITEGATGKVGTKIHDASTKLITYRQGQYNLNGVKITKPVYEFINGSFLNNGFFDMIKEGLTVYDARELDHVQEVLSKHKTITDNDIRRLHEADPVISLMINNIISEITRNNTFGNKADEVVNWIFKIQQDDWFIKKAFVSYLGKIIVSQNIDITKGYTKEIFDAVAAAYGQACYDYVHRPNFINDFENWLRKKNTGAYLGYKLVAPFLASSWNWFTETLDMNPVMLGKNVYKLIRLEKYIDDLERARQDGKKVPFDPRFTEMIVRRKIGKGAIGTISMFLGMMLAAFGVLDVDEDDDKIKLHLWDYTVDISKIYGASSLLFGAVLANPQEGNFLDAIESAFNMTFEDSVVTTVLDMFRYKNTPAEFLSSTATNILMGFIPNIWKSLVRLTNYKKIKYSKGVRGTLQYFVYSTHFAAWRFKIMDVQIDPYTGKEEYRYTGNAFLNILGETGLVGRIKDNKPSQIELAAKALGFNKGPLTGEYDIGKVNYETLNRKYGELNNEWLNKLINDKMTYEVKNKNGNFVSMLWSKMTNEQKISALNGITSKNAHVAKIYAWTNQGGKYYTNNNERLTLAKTYGITENIYIGKDKVFSK